MLRSDVRVEYGHGLVVGYRGEEGGYVLPGGVVVQSRAVAQRVAVAIHEAFLRRGSRPVLWKSDARRRGVVINTFPDPGQ